MPLIDLNGLGYFKGKENAMIAGTFSATKAYKAGEHCYYSGTLYEFTTDHAAGAWNASHVKTAVLADSVSDLKNALNDSYLPLTNYFIDNAKDAGYALRVSNLTVEQKAVCSYSDYISVKPGDVVSFNQHLGSSTFGTGLYNSSKQIQLAYPSNEEYTNFVIPDGIYYIRATLLTATSSTFAINILSGFPNYIRNTMPEEIHTADNPYRRYSIVSYGETIDGLTHFAFPSVALFGDKEIVAYRASKSHVTPTDPTNWGGIMIDYRNPDGSWVHKGLLDTTGYSFNGELRDPKLTVSRDGNTLFLSSFTTYRKESAPSTDVHDNVIFTLNSNLEITSMYHETEAKYVIWGNVLTTPTGYLLITEYKTGTVIVKRGESVFTDTLTGYTFASTAVKTFSATSLSECCLGYWNDKYLVIIMRRGNYSSRFSYTLNLEGSDGWVDQYVPTTGYILHATMLLPNYYGEYLPFMGAEYSSSSLRVPVIGLIKETEDTNALQTVTKAVVDSTIVRYSGYCGFAYLGGNVFATSYYLESTKSTSELNANTALFFKHINLRRMLPICAYLDV